MTSRRERGAFIVAAEGKKANKKHLECGDDAKSAKKKDVYFQ